MEMTTAGSIESVLLSSIRGYIEQEGKRLLDKHLEQVEVELTRAVSEKIGQTVVTLSNMVTFERDGLRLKITVEDRRTPIKGASPDGGK